MEKKGIWISILIIFLIFLSLHFDSLIIEVVSLMRNGLLNDFFIGITFISSKIIIFFLLTILFLWQEDKRKWILPLWVSMGLSAIVGFLLKFTIQRQRPFQLGIISLLPSLEKASYLIWNFSFPSFHAMFAFCVIPILSKKFPKFKYLWIVFASLIAFSRIYLGLHFLSDVIAGAFIGYVLGAIIVKIEQENKFFEKIYKKIFGR